MKVKSSGLKVMSVLGSRIKQHFIAQFVDLEGKLAVITTSCVTPFKPFSDKSMVRMVISNDHAYDSFKIEYQSWSSSYAISLIQSKLDIKIYNC